jgi:vancomycin resistance protein VanW
MKKPIKRSKLRLFVGVMYFKLKKYLYWYFLGIHFAKKIDNYLLVDIFSHKTILRRKLKGVDMWMQENKIVNLEIAIKKLNGLIIEPKQVFSYWYQIGKPTKRKGYLQGMVLSEGKVSAGVGGGLCQLSNLIYWITLHTPLTIIEHYRHSYDVFPDVKRDQPFGSGATCAYPNIDLQFKNNTNQKFQLYFEINDNYLTGKWLSDKPIEFKYKIFDKDHKIKSEWWGAYTRNNKIFRKIIDKKNNKEISEEFVSENKALMMYNPFLENKQSPQSESLK